MDPVNVLNAQIVHQQRFKEMGREADQSALAKLAHEGTPNLWQRMISRLSRLPRIQITTPSVRIVTKPTTTAAHNPTPQFHPIR